MVNSIFGGQLQEPVSVQSMTKLAHEDNQKKDKDEYQHFDEMLMRCEEELKLLEELLREPLEKGITVNDG